MCNPVVSMKIKTCFRTSRSLGLNPTFAKTRGGFLSGQNHANLILNTSLSRFWGST